MKKLNKNKKFFNINSLKNLKSFEGIFDEFISLEKKFQIHEFQRHYNWGKEQCDELLEDIDNNNKDSEYYLGQIIIKPKNEDYIIVDGQQRLTTLSLIIVALSSFLKDKKIRNVLFLKNSFEEKTKINKLRGQDDYSDILKGEIFDEKKLKKFNKNTIKHIENPNFKNRFSDIINFLNKLSDKEIPLFYNKIRKIIFTFTLLPATMDETFVFDSINSKGKELKIDELVKNNLFMELNKIGLNESNKKEIAKQIEDTFDKINNNINANDDALFKTNSKFFQSYINYYFCLENNNKNQKGGVTELNSRRMYKRYQFSWRNGNNKNRGVNSLLKEINKIKKYIEIWNEIYSKFLKNEFHEYSYYIYPIIRNTSYYPLIYFLYTKCDFEEFKKITKYLFRFFLLNKVNGINTKNIFNLVYLFEYHYNLNKNLYIEVKNILCNEVFKDNEFFIRNYGTKMFLPKLLDSKFNNEMFDYSNMDFYFAENKKMTMSIFLIINYKQYNIKKNVNEISEINFDHIIPKSIDEKSSPYWKDTSDNVKYSHLYKNSIYNLMMVDKDDWGDEHYSKNSKKRIEYIRMGGIGEMFSESFKDNYDEFSDFEKWRRDLFSLIKKHIYD